MVLELCDDEPRPFIYLDTILEDVFGIHLTHVRPVPPHSGLAVQIL